MAYKTCEVHNLPVLRTFEDAQTFFNRTKPLQSKAMEENERPMHPKRGGSYKKYKVAENFVNGHKVYDLFFYDTPCVRLYEPNPDGTRHVVINYYPSISTRQFMDRHRWGQRIFATADNGQALVPYCVARSSKYPSAFLTFDADHRLITNRSWHAPMCKYFSSDEDKQARKNFKNALTTLFDLLYVQEQEIRAMARKHVDGWTLQRDRSYESARADFENLINHINRTGNNDYALASETVQTMIDEVASALRIKASSKAQEVAYAKYKEDYYARWQELSAYRSEIFPKIVEEMDMKYAITEARDKFMRDCRLMDKHEIVSLPMFMPTPPKGKYYHDRDGQHFNEAELYALYTTYKKV